MIKAKEIINIIEGTNPDTDEFVRKIRNSASLTELEFIKYGTSGLYSLNMDTELTQDAESSFSCLHKFCGLFRSFLYKKAKSKCMIGNLGNPEKFIQTEEKVFVGYENQIYWQVYEPTVDVGNIRPGWRPIRITFHFTNDLVSKVVGSDGRKFYREIGNIFTSFLDEVSGYRTRKFSHSGDNKKKLDDVILDIAQKSGVKPSINRSEGSVTDKKTTVFYIHDIDFEGPLHGKTTEDVVKSFIEENERRIGIPLKKLESLLGGVLSIVTNEYGNSIIQAELKLRNSKTKVKINLSFLTGGIIFRMYVCFINLEEIIAFCGPKLDELPLAIREVFQGYKKLMMYFVDKPTKKTNADW